MEAVLRLAPTRIPTVSQPGNIYERLRTISCTLVTYFDYININVSVYLVLNVVCEQVLLKLKTKINVSTMSFLINCIFLKIVFTSEAVTVSIELTSTLV